MRKYSTWKHITETNKQIDSPLSLNLSIFIQEKLFPPFLKILFPQVENSSIVFALMLANSALLWWQKKFRLTRGKKAI